MEAYRQNHKYLLMKIPDAKFCKSCEVINYMNDVAETRHVFIWEDKTTWVKADEDFKQYYTHIRGYHGCRPLDIKTYYEKGFLFPQKARLLEHTLIVLANSWATKEQIKMLFDEAWKGYYAKGIYFNICKNELLGDSGHYLIYGSELTCEVARRLGLDAASLKGTPTLFSVDFPLSLVDEKTILDIKEDIMNNCNFETPDDTNVCLLTTQPIPSSLIVACECPLKIKDPFNLGTYYIHKETAF